MGGETDSIMKRVIEYCRSVDSEFRLKRVVLFGSRSRGDFYPHSDIDLLLVSDEFPDDWFTRQAKLYFLKLKQIEPIGYTTSEIRRMMEEGNKFIENVFREGKEIEPSDFRPATNGGVFSRGDYKPITTPQPPAAHPISRSHS